MKILGNADLGLVYLNNRYHDPTLGTFISVDPLVTTTGQPYTYGNANPITYSDPTGLKGCDSNHRCPGGPGGRPRSSGGRQAMSAMAACSAAMPSSSSSAVTFNIGARRTTLPYSPPLPTRRP